MVPPGVMREPITAFNSLNSKEKVVAKPVKSWFFINQNIPGSSNSREKAESQFSGKPKTSGSKIENRLVIIYKMKFRKKDKETKRKEYE